jgi:mono-ADP-ribosyltransferase sirtuin 6
MAHGISDPECKKEYFDSQSELNAKLDQLAQWIKESQHLIVFTGVFNHCHSSRRIHLYVF